MSKSNFLWRQGSGSGSALFGSLDPDPHWDEKIDPDPYLDPNWNQCGSETLLSRTISLRLVLDSYIRGRHTLWYEGDECAGGEGGGGGGRGGVYVVGNKYPKIHTRMVGFLKFCLKIIFFHSQLHETINLNAYFLSRAKIWLPNQSPPRPRPISSDHQPSWTFCKSSSILFHSGSSAPSSPNQVLPRAIAKPMPDTPSSENYDPPKTQFWTITHANSHPQLTDPGLIPTSHNPLESMYLAMTHPSHNSRLSPTTPILIHS